MLKIAGALAGVLLAALLGFAATRPDTFRVERTVTIHAPPAKVYALLEDFHRWGQWSPWERMDPDMKRTYGGAPRGEGALYAWHGNPAVGRGQMEITEALAPSRVRIRIDLVDPIAARHTAEFTLQAGDDATRVTWSLSGPSPFVAKLMSVFTPMDGLVGPEFERGLANLKAVAEK